MITKCAFVMLSAFSLITIGTSATKAQTINEQRVTQFDEMGTRVTRTRTVSSDGRGDAVVRERIEKSDGFGDRISKTRTTRFDRFDNRDVRMSVDKSDALGRRITKTKDVRTDAAGDTIVNTNISVRRRQSDPLLR